MRDLAEILTKCEAGIMHEFEDFEGIKRSLLHYYRLFVSNMPGATPPSKAMESYSRKTLCGKMAALLA